MKKISLLLFSLSLLQGVLAQGKTPAVKVYAYVRESHPGARPNVARENGSPVQKENLKVQSWLIFAELPKGVTIRITHIRINGQRIPVTTEKQATTPVVFHRPGIGTQVETDSLVPATKNTVLKLVPSTDVSIPEIRQSYTVVVQYTLRGLKQSTRPKEIIRLPSLVLQ